MTEINQQLPNKTDNRYIAGDTAVINATIDLADSSDTNLNDTSICFVLAEYVGGDPLIKKTVGDGIEIADAANGKISIKIDETDTVNLGQNKGYNYYYEIEIEDSQGNSATVTTGEWTIYADTASF